MVERFLIKFDHYLLSKQSAQQPVWVAALLHVARLFLKVVYDLSGGQITLRAMSLVFTTLLAVVPMLAVSFSVLKGFGVHNQLEPLLLKILYPLGDQGAEITDRVIGFVENMRVGVLGSLGLVLLLYSAISLIQKVENSFNYIWRLKQSRTLLRRFSDYLSVLIIGPVLMFAALGLNASLLNHAFMQSLLEIETFGLLYRVATALVPYLLIIAAFSFFYMFIPNTKVKFNAALLGGLVSGFVWQATGWFFASFVAASTQYTAIYSGFAILILFIIWVYLNWLILLLGANLVYYIQNPDQLTDKSNELQCGIAGQERLALQVLVLIGKAFYKGDGGERFNRLMGILNCIESPLNEVLNTLKEAGLISESKDEDCLYLPARPFEDITVKHALTLFRASPNQAANQTTPGFEKLDDLLMASERHTVEPLAQISLKSLILN